MPVIHTDNHKHEGKGKPQTSSLYVHCAWHFVWQHSTTLAQSFKTVEQSGRYFYLLGYAYCVSFMSFLKPA